VCLLFAHSVYRGDRPNFYKPKRVVSTELEHADFSAAITLRKTIEELGRAYSGVKEFLSSGGADPEEEFRTPALLPSRPQRRSDETVNYHAATMVLIVLPKSWRKRRNRTSKVSIPSSAARQGVSTRSHDDEVVRRLDRDFALAKRTQAN